MNEILEYLKEFEPHSQIHIEYIMLEPYFNLKGDTTYNIQLLYSPKSEYLTSAYLELAPKMILSEYLGSGAIDFQSILTRILKDKESNFIIDLAKLDNVGSFSIVNLARLFNFKLDSLNDPFLNLYLKYNTIVYASKEFKALFLDAREEFKPSSLSILHAVLLAFEGFVKQAHDFSIYTDSKKLGTLLLDLNKVMRTYFIGIQYHNTKELLSSFDEKHMYILNTLAQANKPWDFVKDCMMHIQEVQKEANTYANYTELVLGRPQQEALKVRCSKLLKSRLIGEFNNET